MTHYKVGSDHSGKGDQACIDAVCKVLEEAGHEVDDVGVSPNSEGSLAGADIAVFIVNGVCLATMHSCYDNLIKGGKCQKVFFGYAKPIMYAPFNDKSKLSDSNYKLSCVNEGWVPAHYHNDDGKWTVVEAFEQYEGVEYAWGDTCEELGNAILAGGGGESTSSGSTDKGSLMSGWESITDLLKPLDGEAMVVVRGDSVIIKRIYPPEATKLWIYEGVNLVDGSVSVSDYTPEIYNTLSIKWGAQFENEMEVSFKKHVDLFGERKKEVNAVYEVPINTSESTLTTEDTAQEEAEKNVSENGSFWDFLGGSSNVEEAKTETTNTSSGSSSSSSTSNSGDSDEPETKEVPITDKAEAYLFGLKEIGRERRKDGHKIECKVIGNKHWEIGEWTRVYIPSFDEDTIMFVSKVNHESGADSEWLTALTLVDYPPSLGSGQSNSPSNDSDSSSSNSSSSSSSSSDTGSTSDTSGGSGTSTEGTDTGSSGGSSTGG